MRGDSVSALPYESRINCAAVSFAPLTSVILCLSISLLFLWSGLVVSFFCGVLWAKVSLALLLWWIHRSKVSLVLLSKFLLDFDSIPIGGSNEEMSRKSILVRMYRCRSLRYFRIRCYSESLIPSFVHKV